MIRTTTETALRITLDLDGGGRARIATSIGFLDHLLTLLAFHSGFDLEVVAAGDVDVDEHHTVEDVMASLGDALGEALGTRAGVARYGSATVPMDEARASAAVDLVRRPHAEIALVVRRRPGRWARAHPVPHALERFAMQAGCTVHVEASGSDDHHVAEAAFKALGRALREACAQTARKGSARPRVRLMKVVIADYGGGNLRSVSSALIRAGCDPVVSIDPVEVREAPLAVIAGVGHVESAARGLAEHRLDEAIVDRVAAARPVLGICVGMQLLCEESEEGGRGLGLLQAPVRRLRARLVPHMGWNALRLTRPSTLLDGLEGADVYFAHSYAVEPALPRRSPPMSSTTAPSSRPSSRALSPVCSSTPSGVAPPVRASLPTPCDGQEARDSVSRRGRGARRQGDQVREPP